MEIWKTIIIGGDLNVCALSRRKNYITLSLEELGFEQLVTQATHIEGRALDHIYVRKGKTTEFQMSLEYFPKFYSDHDGVGLIISES